MNIQTRAAQATKNRRGVMMAPLLVAVTVAAIVVIPIVRWCMAFINGTENINAQLEMKSIIQDYYARISAASYEDMQETIAAKGTTWTEDVGGRYTLKVETSEAGKFENALCNLDETAGAYDQACMKADITLVSNADPSRTVGMQVTRIATLNQLAELADKIEAEGERFADYYTKAEADAQYACPWDYHLVSGKCTPCPAPSNWKQYRSGNCTLGTCSTGHKANAARTGCTKITCPSGEILNGDTCEPECIPPEPNKTVNDQIKQYETQKETIEQLLQKHPYDSSYKHQLDVANSMIRMYKRQRTEIVEGCQIKKCGAGYFPNENQDSCLPRAIITRTVPAGGVCTTCSQAGCACGGMIYYYANGKLVMAAGQSDAIGKYASSSIYDLRCTGVGDLATMPIFYRKYHECATSASDAGDLPYTCSGIPHSTEYDSRKMPIVSSGQIPYQGHTMVECNY